MDPYRLPRTVVPSRVGSSLNAERANRVLSARRVVVDC